ncbi:MAG: twin-arginine translocase subunit TatC [Candidatus Omnitrophica bacterium]|nr:twin-arginine translocase subunit TatC [Candidatus Omnitrophota bacterium]MCM8817573.1 twin-arginine translocase subunit TatC [Candidatus Omnitrophota bacterium]
MNNEKTVEPSFFDHLEEFRRRIIYVVIWFIIACLGSYFFKDKILKFAVYPLSNFQKTPVFVSPLEPFFSILKLIFFSGLIFSFPFLMFQSYLFVKPALSNYQTKVLAVCIACGVILFYTGLGIGYFFLIPYGLQILLSIGKNSISPMITIGNYLTFLIWMGIIIGFAFQLPVIMFFLGFTEIVEVYWFKKIRKVAYVFIFAMVAIMTPTTDAISLIIISGIMIFLYEISLIFLDVFFKRKFLKMSKEEQIS